MSYGASYAQAREVARPAAAPATTSDKKRPLLSSQDGAAERGAQAVIQSAQDAVKDIQRHVSAIQKYTQQLSAPNASLSTTRSKVQDAQKAAVDIAKNADKLLKGLVISGKGQEQTLLHNKQQKLTESLAQSTAQLASAVEAFKLKEAEVEDSLPAVPSTASFEAAAAATRRPAAAAARTGRQSRTDLEMGDVDGPAPQLQEMVISEAEVDMHGAIVAEYAGQVQTVNNNMRELNYCLRSMADMVEEQGEMLDNIESHMSNASESVVAGNEQLEEASATQRRGGKRLVWVLLIASILAAILLIFVFTRH